MIFFLCFGMLSHSDEFLFFFAVEQDDRIPEGSCSGYEFFLIYTCQLLLTCQSYYQLLHRMDRCDTSGFVSGGGVYSLGDPQT